MPRDGLSGPDRAVSTEIDRINRLFSDAFTDRYQRDGLAGVRVPLLNPAIWRFAIAAAGDGALVWRDESGAIAALAEHFESVGELVNVARETRAFRPHVTLIRIKRPGDVSGWLEKVAPTAARVTIDEIVLYQSILHPTGSEYVAVARAKLVGARTSTQNSS